MVATGEEWEKQIVRKFGMDMNTLTYLKWITNKVLLYRTRNSDQCYVAAWVGGVFEGEWIQVCIWLKPFIVHLKLMTEDEMVGWHHRLNGREFE